MSATRKFQVIYGVALFFLQILIDLNRKTWIQALTVYHQKIPFFSSLKIGPEPMLLVVVFTLFRAILYTQLLRLITGSKAFAWQFFQLHLLLFLLSGFLYGVKKGMDNGLAIPGEVHNMLFLITNTPTLFLAALPAYYYIFKKVSPA